MQFASLVVATVLASAALVESTPWHQLHDYTFEDYVAEFGRFYPEHERQKRKMIFEERLAIIRSHNANPTHSWRRGVNQFTDRTTEELAQSKGLDKSLLHFTKHTTAPTFVHESSSTPLPDEFDWRTAKPGTISSTKNQGNCGSCWTFASAETLESHWFLATGNTEDLSEQFILDCTPNPHQCGGTGGCAGGTAELAYTRLKQTGGIPSEWTYPYLSGTGNASKCHGLPLSPEQPHSGSILAAAKVTGYAATVTNSYESVMDALYTKGPLAISVDAGAWHDYETGVFDGGNSTNPDLDHLVQLVGWGKTAEGKEYFIVRNSWTPMWGEHGYIKLARGGDKCGIDLTPADGDGCAGGPDTVKVCGQNGLLYDCVYPLVQ
eukprot:m.144599 g.144599  ORF g.144599 m.144599 type:complete len:378 (-) comp17716_c0_seq1:16-1149(-)